MDTIVPELIEKKIKYYVRIMDLIKLMKSNFKDLINIQKERGFIMKKCDYQGTITFGDRYNIMPFGDHYGIKLESCIKCKKSYCSKHRSKKMYHILRNDKIISADWSICKECLDPQNIKLTTITVAQME
jgi:hypothetical protein